MKRIAIIMLVFILALGTLGAQGAAEVDTNAAEETRSFTDDLGRTVEVPSSIDSVAPSGSMAQVILLTFDASLIDGLTTSMDSEEAAYYSGLKTDIPVLGTFYGKKANLNKEALIVVDPDVVIDIGEIKGSTDEMVSDLDVLQEQIGIPVVFIESYLADTGSTYRRLGELLGDEARGEDLAAYADEVVAYAADIKAELGGQVTFYYSSAVDGLEAIPEGNFHGEVLEAVGGVNVCPATFSSGGNAMSLEQIFIWNPDVIVLGDEDAYKTVTAPSSDWESLDAVKEGRVYLVPELLNNWIDSPPSINRLIGIYWAAEMFYGEQAGVDVKAEAERYYSLFYGYELQDADLAKYGI